jgi:hypothetical protein
VIFLFGKFDLTYKIPKKIIKNYKKLHKDYHPKKEVDPISIIAISFFV